MKNIVNIQLISLLGVILLGFFLYFYKVGEIAPGLGLDEVVSGYNAYSLLLTGKDEYGKFFPVTFRFSNTYSPPLYTYLTIPMVALFELTMAATRMVSVISGTLSIIIVFLLLRKLDVTQNKILLI